MFFNNFFSMLNVFILLSVTFIFVLAPFFNKFEPQTSMIYIVFKQFMFVSIAANMVVKLG